GRLTSQFVERSWAAPKASGQRQRWRLHPGNARSAARPCFWSSGSPLRSYPSGELSLTLPDGPPMNRTTDVLFARRGVTVFNGGESHSEAPFIRSSPPPSGTKPRGDRIAAVVRQQSLATSTYQNSHQSP